MDHSGGAAPPTAPPPRARDSDHASPVPRSKAASDDGNGSDNERVREKLKQTSLAAHVSASAKEDEDMGSDSDANKRRKRSFDESDPEDLEGKETARARVHERKKSREMSEEDLAHLKAGRALDRVKTPPRVDEEMTTTTESVDAKVDKKIERKRSGGKIGEEQTDPSEKKKMRKMEEERRRTADDSATEMVEAAPVEPAPEPKPVEKEQAKENGGLEDKEKPAALPAGSGFANTSAQSPFAAAATAKPIFGAGTTAALGFGALKQSGSQSPFGKLGASSSQSPFGALGAGGSGSVFGSGMKPAFGSPAPKSAPSKPFGAPADVSDDEDSKSDDAQADETPTLEEAKTADGFEEQEVMTGEEHETTLFKNMAKAFAFDKEAKQWKERGRGFVKVNKTVEDADADPPRKKGARLIQRTEGTYTVILNIPVYKGMNLGGAKTGTPPTDGKVYFIVQEDDGITQYILRFKNNDIAKELHELVAELQKELF